MLTSDQNKQKRTLFAPEPISVQSDRLPANRVVSVKLNEDEDIEWTWTTLPNGASYVSGYTITKKTD